MEVHYMNGVINNLKKLNFFLKTNKLSRVQDKHLMKISVLCILNEKT